VNAAFVSTALAALIVWPVAPAAETPGAPVAFSGHWTRWQRAAPILDAAPRGAGYVRVPLDERVDAGADGTYASLRVVTAAGVETPYALDPDATSSVDRERAEGLPIVDSGFVRGAYTQVVLDLGRSGDVREAVRIATSKPTYFERVSVEASDDRTTWRSLRDETIVYAVSGDAGGRGDDGNQTIAFPATRSRWLRLRVLDGIARFPIEAAYVDDTSHGKPLVPVSATASYALDGHRQIWTYGFGSAYVPVSAVELVGAKTVYARSLRVETSDDGGTTFVTAAESERYAYRPGSAAPSDVFGPIPARLVRVTLDNGDDLPVPGLRPVLLRTPHEIVYPARPGQRYALLASTFVTSPPVYDLATVLAARTWRADRLAMLGPFAPNTAFRDPRSFAERLPWLVGVAFALAAVVLGGLAISTIRSLSMQSGTASDGTPSVD
jgi:hypothetical protein